ncbi:hypothetical protein M011DRAFT_449283 [Sporormia fimetaria CBS 119925]|uniref:Uncharacterized protein n=1 Tax=Sporormia fimetaria CBS 119925 TaxID=1340428 RepID=A0A6A6V4D0_9PLEO|nr:hypothetical protein M011DRAFT_449283 [Sporormia fimetaria CBS 119925]
MVISTPNTSLTANDARILNALFDPETLPSSVASAKDRALIDSNLPPHPTISFDEIASLEAQQNELVKQAASSDSAAIQTVWAELDNIISQHPKYPSAYLNRAMVRRMKLEASVSGPTGSLYDAPEQEVAELFADLADAIKYALPSGPSGPASTYQARILRTAHSHRAYLYLKASEKEVQWKGMGRSELEELASHDFGVAARYGDEVAREMSVRTNPYAKMCGAIVRNALAKERNGEE